MLGTEEGYEFLFSPFPLYLVLFLIICLSYGNSDVALGDYRVSLLVLVFFGNGGSELLLARFVVDINSRVTKRSYFCAEISN